MVEMRRNLLNDQWLPYKFWAKGINTSCYICDKFLVKSIISKATEVYYCKVPNIYHFMVFGSRYYILNTMDQLYKFATKPQNSLFLRFALNISYYRVFNLETNVAKEYTNVVVDKVKLNKELAKDW